MPDLKPPIQISFHGLPAGTFADGEAPTEPGIYKYEPFRGIGHYEFIKYLQLHGVAECFFESGASNAYFLVSAIQAPGQMAVSSVSDTPILPNHEARMKLVEQLFGPKPDHGA